MQPIPTEQMAAMAHSFATRTFKARDDHAEGARLCKELTATTTKTWMFLLTNGQYAKGISVLRVPRKPRKDCDICVAQQTGSQAID